MIVHDLFRSDKVGYIWRDTFLELAYIETVILLPQQQPDDTIGINLELVSWTLLLTKPRLTMRELRHAFGKGTT